METPDIKKNLSSDQKQALITLLDWLKQPDGQYITLGGYAGTGKTTLIALLSQILHQHNPKIKIAFVSFTGKATTVLKTQLGFLNSLGDKDFVGTIHSLIYSPMIGGNHEIIGWNKKDKMSYDLIIVDEASMVDQNIWLDLLSYSTPILAVGDHGQLPPINGNFNLMENPDLRLENIHRQAQDNPIIQLSIKARTDGQIPFDTFAPRVKKIRKDDYSSQDDIESLMNQYHDDTLILCGYNNTRIKLNNYVRQLKGIETPEPIVGDKVICLRNNHKKQIFNGMVGQIKNITPENPEWHFSEISFDGNANFKGLISAAQFNQPTTMSQTKDRKKTLKGDLFDFGYAMTVHKAQGSQAQRVILFEERFKQMDDLTWRRWLYTAITRAVEELYIIG